MKSRSILTLFILCILALELSAQEGKEMQYLFSGDKDISITGFGGPFVGFSSIGDEIEVSAGGGGAVLFNQQFFIGGFGEGTATTHEIDLTMYDPVLHKNQTYSDLNLRLGYGGFWLGYIHNPHKPVHFGISSKIGFGAITLNQGHFRSDHEQDFEYDNVFVLVPQIEMEMNLLKWMKMNVGVGYRLVTGINKEFRIEQADGQLVYQKYFEADDFNKPTGHIGFLFGWFAD